METTLKSQGVELEYPKFWSTTSESLLTFNNQYKQEARRLIEHLKTNPSGPILFKRLIGNSIHQKTIDGTVKDIKENEFCFVASKSLEDMATYENLHETHIRTDNVLGWIPFLPSSSAEELNPYRNYICEETKDYFFVFLPEVKKLLKSCVGKTHKATLCCRYPMYKKEIIDCKIVKVNRSNVEIQQYRSVKTEKGNPSIVLGTLTRTILFIDLECYLQKVNVAFGSKYNISPFDDGEVF